MRHTTRGVFLLLLMAVPIFAQGTASLSITQSFTSAAAGSPVNNGPTLAGGPQGSVGFRLIYYIQPGSGTVSALSIELDGAATSGGSYTALTPAVGGGSGSGATTNPVTTFPQGQNVSCCDYYPWIQIKVNTLTVASGAPVLIVKVLGYAGTSAAAGGGGGGGGITELTQDVLAGPGFGSVPATVVGIKTVPLCSGFSPTNAQTLKYTTSLSPNPCWTASAGGNYVIAQSQTAAGAATLDFVSWFDSAADFYEIWVENLIPSTTGLVMQMQFSTNGGATWDSAGNYNWSQFVYSGAGTAVAGANADGSIQFFPYQSRTMFVSSTFTMSGKIQFYNPGSGTAYKNLTGFFLGNDNINTVSAQPLTFSAWYTNTAAVNGIRFQISSGTFTGTIRIYKLTH